eukprot:scaffold10026_cov187-Skeletonema_menzelii.AAC.6
MQVQVEASCVLEVESSNFSSLKMRERKSVRWDEKLRRKNENHQSHRSPSCCLLLSAFLHSIDQIDASPVGR